MTKQLEHLRRRDVFFHGVKTSKLIGALVTDRRISIIRKLLFLGSIILFLGILIFPDLFSEALLSIVMPIVGTVLGIPLDAGFDWVAFSLLVVSLLRFFPAEMVAEHYRDIF